MKRSIVDPSQRPEAGKKRGGKCSQTSKARPAATRRQASGASEATTENQHATECPHCNDQIETIIQSLQHAIEQFGRAAQNYPMPLHDPGGNKRSPMQIAEITLAFTILCVVVGLFTVEIGTYQEYRKITQDMAKLQSELNESRRAAESGQAMTTTNTNNEKPPAKKKPRPPKRSARLRAPVV